MTRAFCPLARVGLVTAPLAFIIDLPGMVEDMRQAEQGRDRAWSCNDAMPDLPTSAQMDEAHALYDLHLTLRDMILHEMTRRTGLSTDTIREIYL